jgi:peroxiredoxin
MTEQEHAMRADIAPGGTFPDYELSDHTETRRSLSELQGDDPLILVLARGHYCPKDHQQHVELAAAYPKMAVAYTQIVTISTDNILETREFRASVGAQWTFLSDAGRKLQKDLDIQEYTDHHHDPMVPHTLVLKPGLVIHSLYNGYWFWGRPSRRPTPLTTGGTGSFMYFPDSLAGLTALSKRVHRFLRRGLHRAWR